MLFTTMIQKIVVEFFNVASKPEILAVLNDLKALGIMPTIISALEEIDAVASQLALPLEGSAAPVADAPASAAPQSS